jgi:peptidoglycan/xylan/chitin deacetylase (PgdA/CDA1 family)
MRSFLASTALKILAARDERTLARLLRLSLGAHHVALCFHRVASCRRERELIPKLTMAPEEIDRLVEFLHGAADRPDRWLTMCFDDGYRDAAEYILSRAPRFPQVDWIFFVCPEKTDRGVGFRWDLTEVLREEGSQVEHDDVVFSPVDVATENERNDLCRVAADPRFVLADVELCREIQRLPNGALGNHTNVHHRAMSLAPHECRSEYERSTQDFRRLFGEPRHFAFPFGVPGADFDERHVAALRNIGSFHLWSTEPRPYDPLERVEGTVLPRFAIDGTRSWKETIAHIIVRSLREKVSNAMRRRAGRTGSGGARVAFPGV